MTDVFHVCIPNTSRDFFDYSATNEKPAIGSRVWVPFGNKKRLGIAISQGVNHNSHIKIKPISEIIDTTPILSENTLALCRWVAQYYQAPLSEVIASALPKNLRLGKPLTLKPITTYQLATSSPDAHAKIKPNASRQHALIDYLAEHPHPLTKKELFAANYTASQIQALINAEVLDEKEQTQAPNTRKKSTEPLALNAEQAIAVETITKSLDKYRCFLLKGVTGSGKTEVYLHIIRQVLTTNRQVLILVPEIGLTPQLLSRFTARFTEQIVVVHSHLSDGERQRAWHLAYTGQAQLVIGTRGAIFTPLPNLGLIIIDEEHDSSLKQMDRVRYSARDTALVRAHNDNVPIILGSATPSLESLHNARIGKYTLLTLNQRALSTTPLRYQLVDIRNMSLHDGLASTTLKTIEEHLNQQQQVLVFINRRGFSPVLLCHSCGWMADCHHCDSHLTLHRKHAKLVCHHCGAMQAIPRNCKSCQAGELVPIGSGTQRIYEFFEKKFPQNKLIRIDRDTVQKKDALSNQLAQIDSGEAQLIVGTQMLAKGHHFPRLTLVVVLDADAGLYNQDFRAIESLGQLLTQVAGRAGRAKLPGHVIIQTHLPQHPLLNTLIQQGYDAFAEALLVSRKQAMLPPFHYLAAIRAQGPKIENVLAFLHRLKHILSENNLETMGPAPAPLSRKAGHHRMQLLLKSPSRVLLQKALTHMRASITMQKLDRRIRWNIDVDPLDLS